MILNHLYTAQCPEGPEYYFIVNYPNQHLFIPIDTPDDVRTILIIFLHPKCPIRPIGIHWSSTEWFRTATVWLFGGWLRLYNVAYLCDMTQYGINSAFGSQICWLGIRISIHWTWLTVGRTPNQMLFNPIDIPHSVQTIQDNFWMVKNQNWILYTWFICQIVSGWTGILFWLDKLRIGCYSTRLVCQIMSEPFWIIFEWSKVGIRCYTLFYMPNSVWMDQNIILIGQTLNQMLFNPIDIPDNVRTIPDNFWMGKSRNQMLCTLLHAK